MKRIRLKKRVKCRRCGCVRKRVCFATIAGHEGATVTLCHDCQSAKKLTPDELEKRKLAVRIDRAKQDGARLEGDNEYRTYDYT